LYILHTHTVHPSGLQAPTQPSVNGPGRIRWCCNSDLGYDLKVVFYGTTLRIRRGFSSKTQLESHTRFFHPKKVSGAFTPHKAKADTAPVAHTNHERRERSSPRGYTTIDGTLAYIFFASTEERVTCGGPEPPGPVESSLGPPTVIQDDVTVPPAVTASTPLSLQCRICGTPAVGTQPAVTMCGHLFYSEYVLKIPRSTAVRLYNRCITQHIMSTSSCPVRDDAQLLYCSFKLGLLALLS